MLDGNAGKSLDEWFREMFINQKARAVMQGLLVLLLSIVTGYELSVSFILTFSIKLRPTC